MISDRLLRASNKERLFAKGAAFENFAKRRPTARARARDLDKFPPSEIVDRFPIIGPRESPGAILKGRRSADAGLAVAGHKRENQPERGKGREEGRRMGRRESRGGGRDGRISLSLSLSPRYRLVPGPSRRRRRRRISRNPWIEGNPEWLPGKTIPSRLGERVLGYDLNSRLPVYEATPYYLVPRAAFIESGGIPRVHTAGFHVAVVVRPLAASARAPGSLIRHRYPIYL